MLLPTVNYNADPVQSAAIFKGGTVSALACNRMLRLQPHCCLAISSHGKNVVPHVNSCGFGVGSLTLPLRKSGTEENFTRISCVLEAGGVERCIT